MLPLTPDEERRALAAIGVQSVDDLFATIPPRLRENAAFTLDWGDGIDGNRGLAEHELHAYFARLALKNACQAQYPPFRHFLGGGTYDPIVPAAVTALASRGEWLTAPVPLVAEASQGTLQAVFELQSLVRRIAATEIAAVTYADGSAATAEGVLMALRLAPATAGKLVVMAGSVPPETRAVVRSFLSGHAPAVPEIPWGNDGGIDVAKLAAMCASDPPAVVLIASPNYFGVVEPLEAIRAALPKDTLLVVTVADIASLALLEPPARLGADITCGDLQQLGHPLAFGSGRLGYLAARREHLAQLPGWLSAEASDGYRPHYPRATSGDRKLPLCPSGGGTRAVRAAATLALLGTQGFVELAERCHSLFRHLAEELAGVGIPLRFKGGAAFREGVFEVPNLEKRFLGALQKGIAPGTRLGRIAFPGTAQGDFSNSLLVCCHPRHTRADLEQLVEVLSHD